MIPTSQTEVGPPPTSGAKLLFHMAAEQVTKRHLSAEVAGSLFRELVGGGLLTTAGITVAGRASAILGSNVGEATANLLASHALRSARQISAYEAMKVAVKEIGILGAIKPWEYHASSDRFTCNCAIQAKSKLIACAFEATFYPASVVIATKHLKTPMGTL